MNLRSKLIRLAHQRPELRADILPLLTKQAGKVAFTPDPKMLKAVHQELLKGGKAVMAAIGKMAAIEKKIGAMTRKGGADSDVAKLIAEYNGWAAAIRKTVTGFIGSFDSLSKGLAPSRYLDIAHKDRDQAVKVLHDKNIVEGKSAIAANLEMLVVHRSVDTLYNFLEGYAVVLSQATGGRILDANQYKGRLASRKVAAGGPKVDPALIAEGHDILKKLEALQKELLDFHRKADAAWAKAEDAYENQREVLDEDDELLRSYSQVMQITEEMTKMTDHGRHDSISYSFANSIEEMGNVLYWAKSKGFA